MDITPDFFWEGASGLSGSPSPFSPLSPCRCSLPRSGLGAAARFTSWLSAGPLFWAGRSGGLGCGPGGVDHENPEILATGVWSCPGRVGRGLLPAPTRSYQSSPFSSCPVRNKSRLHRSWCCWDCHQVLSVLGWSGGQNACAFPPAPAFLVCGSMLGRLRVETRRWWGGGWQV